MHSRTSNGFPRWLTFTVAALLAISGYFIVRGFLNFVDAGGNIISPNMTSTAIYQAQVEKITRQYLSTLDFSNITPLALTPTQACIEYRVRVVKARIRDCPRESCETIALPDEGATICVLGIAPDDPDWYQVIVDPADPFPETGYMHKSVLLVVKPNKTSSPTPTLDVATVTPLPATTVVSPVVPVGSVEAPTKAPMSETATPTPTVPTPSNTPSATNTPKQRPVVPPGS